MPKARYLAPWRQADLVEAVSVSGAALDQEALAVLQGKPAIYHCISRVVDRRFVFETREKEKFVALMRRYEAFCQVRVLAYCVMSNHFHLLVEVPAPPDGRGSDWSDERFLDHLGILYSEHQMAEIRWRLEYFRKQKNHVAATEYRDSFFLRMWDLSEFMKPLKQCFSRWFNKIHERHGTLWEERFKSVLVEDGHAARVVSAYIDLNPVRAGLARDPGDYRWCSFGEATGGKQRARDGIQRVMCESAAAWGSEEEAAEILTSWRAAVRGYREVLYAYLHRGKESETMEESGLGLAEALDNSIRAFSDGMAVGKGAFIDAVFHMTRGWFGPRRKEGARQIRGVETELRAMRDLQPRPTG